jgi:hypothetical protein
VAKLDRCVVGVWAISRGSQVATAVNFAVPVPNRDRLNLMLLQAQIMADISVTNEDLYGEFEFLLIRHRVLDALLFRIGRGGAVLAMGCKRPYREMHLVGRVSELIAKAKAQEDRG